MCLIPYLTWGKLPSLVKWQTKRDLKPSQWLDASIALDSLVCSLLLFFEEPGFIYHFQCIGKENVEQVI